MAGLRSLVNTGFHLASNLRVSELESLHPPTVQQATLRRLLHRARYTRFGRDHEFAPLKSIPDFQARVPCRSYEQIWDLYLRDAYPVFENLLWPGRIPYLALTSGTTRGTTKYIPVSREMIAANSRAARTMLAHALAGRPDARLFHGRIFFLGGSTQLEKLAPGVQAGDLSAIAAVELARPLRAYTFPPLELALESNWDRKLEQLARQSLNLPITLVGGVPSWLLALFDRLLELSGKATIAEIWPTLELVVHGGVRFDPYRSTFESILGSPAVDLQETYPCSEGFIGFGDRQTGLLRLVFDHGIFYEFVPRAELASDRPARFWLGNAQTGVDYAIVVSTCAGMWAHLIGDVIRFECLDPPLFRFIGRTRDALSAFGEHLISDEVEQALARASAATGAQVSEWHLGPVFEGRSGYHQYIVEFRSPLDRLLEFRNLLDQELCRLNADYHAHRTPGAGMPAPEVLATRPGGFQSWMRTRGKLGGQHKVPRIDPTGELTRQIANYLHDHGLVANSIRVLSSAQDSTR